MVNRSSDEDINSLVEEAYSLRNKYDVTIKDEQEQIRTKLGQFEISKSVESNSPWIFVNSGGSESNHTSEGDALKESDRYIHSKLGDLRNLHSNNPKSCHIIDEIRGIIASRR